MGRHCGSRQQDVCGANEFGSHKALHPDGTDPGDLVLGPHLRLRHHGLCRRAVGQTLDHHRHLPSRPRARPRPHHGRPLPLVSACRQPRGATQGSGARPVRAVESIDRQRHPARLRLRTRAAHHPEVHRQQRRNRRSPRAASAQSRSRPGRPQSRPRGSRHALHHRNRRAQGRRGGLQGIGGRNGHPAIRRTSPGECPARMGSAERGPERLARGRLEAARCLLGGPHRPAEGDRRLDRRQGGPRVSLRQALHRQCPHPRRGPLSPSRVWRRIGCWRWTRTTSSSPGSRRRG